MNRKVLDDYPDLIAYIERFENDFNVPTDEIKALIDLFGELRYRDGYVDGIHYIMREFLNS